MRPSLSRFPREEYKVSDSVTCELTKKEKDLDFNSQDVWKALKEIESYRLELEHAATTDLTQNDRRYAEYELKAHLDDLGRLTDQQTRREAEFGRLDVVRDRFY